ncbi:FtsX-like permease family protein [Chitinimonas koreensis]|uniref:FtsX-like permease family protein n=1 Tax=Chitinimonas koreensis TaxID=356302 RepID=UPI001654BA16|nr:FtsX-like permease family protein [Chitinimonas koreensis]QNM95729.1 FtsX-like permease family protein [Chitinimonas koreensis]
MVFGPLLKARQAPLDLISRSSSEALDVRMQGVLQRVPVLAADPDLPALLGIRALHGDLKATLGRVDAIAVTPALVRKLWGELPPAQALGRSVESRGKSYLVTAVIPPIDPRSPLGPHDAMASFELVGRELRNNVRDEAALDAIYLASGRVYGRLRPGASADQVGGWMRAAFLASPKYAELPAEWRTGREAAFFRGIPLDRFPFEGPDNAVRWQLLGALGAASVLLLILAAFNTMNLQAAGLLQRQRETALRRALGADNRQLLQLWTAEALLQLLLSAGGALLLAWWLAPLLGGAVGLPPEQPIADPLPWQALAGLAAVVLALLPLLLGLPAWLALRRAPAPALQGRTASEGPWGRRLRQGLLALQLGGALLLLSLTGVMSAQHQYLLEADRGFQTRDRLILSAIVQDDTLPDLGAFVTALKQHPAVRHWGFSNARPMLDTSGPTELHVSADRHKQLLRLTTVTAGYFETYGMKLLAGDPWAGSGEGRLVLDAKAARALGFASPQAAIGATLTGGGDYLQEGSALRRVVAVIGDVKQESAREAAMPQGFLVSDQPQWDLTVYGPDPEALRLALDQLWQAHGPQLLHKVWTADELRSFLYEQEALLTAVLAFVALLAVAVSMLGAYALVADTLRRRRTELVLHRLHGAGPGAIAGQVAAEFAWPLLLAAVAGLPLAAWLGRLYLADFVERVDPVDGLVVPLAVASAATVAVVTLAALRHLRLALALQPIEALD